MTTEETALADKLLKEATNTSSVEERSELLNQYHSLLRAAEIRKSASSPSGVHPHAATGCGVVGSVG